MPSIITVIVSVTGETRITTTGFSGGQCRTATQALEAALGQRQSETLTAEFYAPASEAAAISQRPSTAP